MANCVGEDEFGNRYYRTKGGNIDPTLKVRTALGDLSPGVAEASTVPPSWFCWLHHTVDVPPTQEKAAAVPLGEAAPAPISLALRAHTARVARHWLKDVGPRRRVITSPGFLAIRSMAAWPLATDPWNCRNQTVNRAHSLETPLSSSRPYFPRSIVQIAACAAFDRRNFRWRAGNSPIRRHLWRRTAAATASRRANRSVSGAAATRW